MEIEITTNHSQSSYGIPVCLINGDIVDDADGFAAACKALGWSRETVAEKTGKSLGAIDRYRTKGPGAQPVPAEVWNVLKDALEQLPQ